MRVGAVAFTIAAIVTMAAAGSVLAQQTVSQAGMSISAQSIEISRATSRIIAIGNVHVEASNKAVKTYFAADAAKMVVTLFANPGTKGALNGLAAVKSAVFSGPVKMLYTAPKPVKDEATGKTTEVDTKTEARADSVTFDGPAGLAYLTGSVKITEEDPSMFAVPAVMTGEKATINLGRLDRGEQPDFKIETPNGVSRIEVTPNRKLEAPKKK